MNTKTTYSDTIISYWQNKRVLITGGTRGLGLALTNELDSIGSVITIVARSKEELETVSLPSDNIYMIKADVSIKEDIHRITGQAIGMMEGIDILINSASYLGRTPLRPLLDTECEDFEEVLQTNLLGPFRLSKAIIPYMKFHPPGLIINISSDAAINPYPTWGAYSVSKIALDHMTAIWNEELRNDDITFLSIDPGDMATEMHFDAIPDANPENLYNPELVAKGLIQFIGNAEEFQTRYSACEWRKNI